MGGTVIPIKGTTPDISKAYQGGIEINDRAGDFCGTVEVRSSNVRTTRPTLEVAVIHNGAWATARQHLAPDELRELAGALKRAADHHDAVQADGGVA